jgi:hypothetical protein
MTALLGAIGRIHHTAMAGTRPVKMLFAGYLTLHVEHRERETDWADRHRVYLWTDAHLGLKSQRPILLFTHRRLLGA